MAIRQHVIIIGAGIGGLALANILAYAGYQVSVYEKNAQPGGRVGLLEVGGFRFDTGPSWYLMPEVFEHYFGLLGENVAEYLSLVRLDPAYQVLYESRPKVTMYGDPKKDIKTFEEIEPGSSVRLTSYLEKAERTYELAKKHFLYNTFSNPLNMLTKETIRTFPGMASSLYRNMHENASRYVHNSDLQKVLEYPAVFLGSSPYEAPALYSLMSYLDFKQGVYYPTGGMYRIIEALVSIGSKHGVTYHYNSPVTQIRTDSSHRATAIVLKNGQEVVADIVVSNADLHFTETSLLPQHLQTYPERYWAHANAGPSALLMYLGIKGALPTLQHHNLLFCDDWEQGFKNTFKDKRWSDPASLYICVSSKTDSSVAPKGYENVFVLVPGPAVLPSEPAAVARLAAQYITQIADMAEIPDLQKRIVYRSFFGPAEFSQQFNAWRGTALGMSHTLRQSAFFRPRNKSKKVPNLYYVGSGTQPGIGLPMCLISAETVYKRLIGDTSSHQLAAIRRR